MNDFDLDIISVDRPKLSTRPSRRRTWFDVLLVPVVVLVCGAWFAFDRRAEPERIIPVPAWREQNDAHLAKVADRAREAAVQVVQDESRAREERLVAARAKVISDADQPDMKAYEATEQYKRTAYAEMFAANAEREEARSRANRQEARWQAWQVKEREIYQDFKGRLEAADRHARSLSRNNAAAYRRQARVKASIDVATTFKMRPAEVIEIFERRSNGGR
jgi:hypothetical protein